MAVICDTFDYSDYPVYFKNRHNMMVVEMNPGNMQRVMETYNLKADMFEQLSKDRNWVTA